MQVKRLMSLGTLRVVENLYEPLFMHRHKILAKYPAPELPQLSGGFSTSEPGISPFFNLAEIPQKGYYWEAGIEKGGTPVLPALPKRTSARSTKRTSARSRAWAPSWRSHPRVKV